MNMSRSQGHGDNTDVAFSSIGDLGRMLRAKQISSVELTKLYLQRLQHYGPHLNSVVTLLPERALAQAASADKELAGGSDRGPLHGIPYGAKDLLAAKDAPTTWGAAPYRKQTFDYNATVIDRLGNAGAVLLGKLAMIELAGGMGYNQADACITGPCKTPWSLSHWSGGSSSGSGSCVSAGLVPFAIGSETDGSITNPSSYCGVTGLRPTYGRVSRYGAMALSWTLDKLGPLCRNAQDAGLVLEAIAGYDALDFTSSRSPVWEAHLEFIHRGMPAATPSGAGQPIPAPRRWRIATVGGTREKLQPEVKRNFETSLHELGRIAEISHVTLPKFPYDGMIGAIIAAEAASLFRDIIENGRVQTLRDPSGRRGGYSYMAVNAVDYIDAMRQRAALRLAFEKIFRHVDLLVAPTFSTVAYPIDTPFDKVYPGTNDGDLITACNLAGIPAISVPNGFGLHGLPTGLMFVGRAFAEQDLVEAAAAYQGMTSFHRKRPPNFG
jgi:aspartyl-tRNA(Asn)/glutamyl-tRNA(Gln) amidotransferase subunit A